MESLVPADTRSPLSVRRAVWLIFCAALLLALAVPLATVTHEQGLTLRAQATVWPANPQVGRAAHLVVSLADTKDQAAVGGPWAELVAVWTMPQMAMGSEQATMQGTQGGDGTFVVPLQLTMAGRWSVAVTLQTPGRPTWHGRLTITVSPGSAVPSVAVT